MICLLFHLLRWEDTDHAELCHGFRASIVQLPIPIFSLCDVLAEADKYPVCLRYSKDFHMDFADPIVKSIENDLNCTGISGT